MKIMERESKLKIELEILNRYTALLEACVKKGMTEKEIYYNLVSDLREEAGLKPLRPYHIIQKELKEWRGKE